MNKIYRTSGDDKSANTKTFVCSYASKPFSIAELVRSSFEDKNITKKTSVSETIMVAIEP